MFKTISKKISLLNQTALDSLVEVNPIKIVEKFTETGLQILEADFGFAWWKVDNEYQLVYKSANTPYNPKLPRQKGGNFEAEKTRAPFFVETVSKENYEKGFDVSPYMKSYVIIPITYKDHLYGNIVLCYKKQHNFSYMDEDFSKSLGNSTAQVITINSLVSSEQEARLQSEKREAYYKALTENSYEIVFLINEYGKINYASPSSIKYFGMDLKNIIGKKVKDFLFTDKSNSVQDYIKKVLATPKIICVSEFCYKYKDGSTRTLESTAFNMIDNPNVGGIVINMRDISSRKRLESEKEVKRLLEEEKLKTEFIANATHELRTPLAIIKGNVDLILRESAGRSRRYADGALMDIDEEVKHLANILSDLALLTMNKDAPRGKVLSQNIKLHDLLDSTIKRWRVIAAEKKITIKRKITALTIPGDERYLSKLFVNLIKNAIFYGKDGGYVLIEVLKKKQEVVIKVEDNGIGISKEDLPHIFSRFYRADKSHTDDRRTGLGLAICRWVVEAHGGRIHVESELGKGSVFTVHLPSKKISS